MGTLIVDPKGPADGANAYRFDRFLQVFGISQAEAGDAFRHLDRNGNGVMERAEIIQAQKEFFASDDPNAAGNWLLGSFWGDAALNQRTKKKSSHNWLLLLFKCA